MAPRVIDINNNYEHERTKFDQMRPILASASTLQSAHVTTQETASTHDSKMTTLTNNSTILNMSQLLPSDTSPSKLFDIAGDIIPTISVLVHSTMKPDHPETIQECFITKNPFRTFWIQTIYEQYDKNASYRVFTQPISKLS